MNKVCILSLVLFAGCAHTRTACWQKKEAQTLTPEYLNCMRDVKIAPRINACYADQAKKEADFHMKLVTAFDVTPEGRVKNAKISPSDQAHSDLAKCMVSAVEDQSFIKSQNGDVHVELPWVLRKETNTLFQF